MRIVTCESDHIDFLGTQVTTKEELRNAVLEHYKDTGGSFMCSSTMDWPEDYTDDPNLIYLCDLVRGNNVSGENPDFDGLESLFKEESE